MADSKALFEERMGLRMTMLAGGIPARVPVYPEFTIEAACGVAGIDVTRAYYDLGLVRKAYEAVSDTFYADCFPVGYFRYPSVYQMLGSRNWRLSSSGTLQHPEVNIMEPGEYDEYTADPYAFITDKVFSRACSNLAGEGPGPGLRFGQAMAAHARTNGENFGMVMEFSQKYGYSPGVITGQGVVPPFDLLADQLRGFEGLLVDLRRQPDKVEAAVEATYQMMRKFTRLTANSPISLVFFAFHMPAFINQKQFERLFWPTTERLIRELDAEGKPSFLLAEQNLTRYATQFEALPASTVFSFEAGDAKVLKETVGKNHVIGGFWDPTLTLTRSTEECIDSVKRLFDICMPGGRFFFRYDRPVIDVNSVDIKKLAAVHEWVHENATY